MTEFLPTKFFPSYYTEACKFPMLPQEEYVEIDAYPGYETNREWSLPQMFLVGDGRILMYAMGEYFLLEQIEEGSKNGTASEHMPDLSGWIGRYVFSEEKANLFSYKMVKKNRDEETTRSDERKPFMMFTRIVMS